MKNEQTSTNKQPNGKDEEEFVYYRSSLKRRMTTTKTAKQQNKRSHNSSLTELKSSHSIIINIYSVYI